MPHRSTGARAIVLALLALVVPASATAATLGDDSFAVPADAPAVATTAAGATVLAWTRGGKQCTALQRPGSPRPARASSLVGMPGQEDVAPGSCDTTPVLAGFAGRLLGTFELADGSVLAWGDAGAGAASVRLKRGERTVAEAPAVPSTLGPRFWALQYTPGDQVDEVALADETGTVRRAYDPIRFGVTRGVVGDEDEPGKPTGTLLRQGRAGARTWQLRRVVRRELAATPLLPERHVERDCLMFVARTQHGSGTSTGPCTGDALDQTPMVADAGGDCGLGTHVEALVTSAVRRVVVIAGDGSRRAVPLSSFGPGVRAGALVLGTGLAVRRVVALGAGGRALTTQELGLAPAGADAGTCVSDSLSLVYGVGDDGRLRAGPHAARFADHGVELCATIDRAPRVPADCALPPTEPESTGVQIRPTADGRFVFGVVEAEIAAARVTLDDGAVRTIAAQPLTGYAGLYAGTLREIAADLPGPHVVERIELLDDRGRVLNGEAGLELAYGPAVTVLPAAHGLPAVHATPLRARRDAATCFTFGPLSESSGCEIGGLDGGVGVESVSVHALCAPRRLVVSALLARRDDRLVLRTTSGREVVARRVRLLADAGAVAGKYYALAVLGPRDGLSTVIVRSRAPHRLRTALPSAARQCGYSMSPGLFAALGL